MISIIYYVGCVIAFCLAIKPIFDEVFAEGVKEVIYSKNHFILLSFIVMIFVYTLFSWVTVILYFFNRYDKRG